MRFRNYARDDKVGYTEFLWGLEAVRGQRSLDYARDDTVSYMEFL